MREDYSSAVNNVEIDMTSTRSLGTKLTSEHEVEMREDYSSAVNNVEIDMTSTRSLDVCNKAQDTNQSNIQTIKEILSKVPSFSVERIIEYNTDNLNSKKEIYIFDCSKDISCKTEKGDRTTCKKDAHSYDLNIDVFKQNIHNDYYDLSLGLFEDLDETKSTEIKEIENMTENRTHNNLEEKNTNCVVTSTPLLPDVNTTQTLSQCPSSKLSFFKSPASSFKCYPPHMSKQKPNIERTIRLIREKFASLSKDINFTSASTPLCPYVHTTQTLSQCPCSKLSFFKSPASSFKCYPPHISKQKPNIERTIRLTTEKFASLSKDNNYTSASTPLLPDVNTNQTISRCPSSKLSFFKSPTSMIKCYPVNKSKRKSNIHKTVQFNRNKRRNSTVINSPSASKDNVKNQQNFREKFSSPTDINSPSASTPLLPDINTNQTLSRCPSSKLPFFKSPTSMIKCYPANKSKGKSNIHKTVQFNRNKSPNSTVINSPSATIDNIKNQQNFTEIDGGLKPNMLVTSVYSDAFKQNKTDTSYPNSSGLSLHLIEGLDEPKPTAKIEEQSPSSTQKSFPSVFNTHIQSKNNQYSRSISESSDSENSNPLQILEYETINSQEPLLHLLKGLDEPKPTAKIEEQPPSSTQKSFPSVFNTHIQSKNNQYSRSISESSDSENSNPLQILEYETINSQEPLLHLLEGLDEPKPTAKIEEQPPSSTQKSFPSVFNTHIQSKNNQYSRSISESSDSENSNPLQILEYETINSQEPLLHLLKGLDEPKPTAKIEEQPPSSTQKSFPSVFNTHIQSKNNQYSRSISESSDSENSNPLQILEYETINSQEPLLHLLEGLDEPKPTAKIEEQPSTSNGLKSKFIPLFYIETTEKTEESVPNQSQTKPPELEFEDIIQIEKSCDLNYNATCYVESSILEQSFKIDSNTEHENKKRKNFHQNLWKETRICNQIYNDIFQKKRRHLLHNVQLLKEYCVEAQVKSLLPRFATEKDVSIKKPIFNPKNIHNASILEDKQHDFIKCINEHLIEFNGNHPFLKCLHHEVFNYIRNFRDEHIKTSKCIQLTELLAMLCSKYNLLNIAQAFIKDCLYWLRMMAFPLIFSMVKIYPQVLPNSKMCNDPLNKVIIHCILETSSTSKHISDIHLLALKRVLWYRYNYSSDSENPLTLLKTLLRKITEPGVIEAVVLLCKKENYEWTYTHVVAYFINVFIGFGVKNEEFAIASVRLIGVVMKAFPKDFPKEHVDIVISKLNDLLFACTGSSLLKEEIAMALCNLIRFNPTECVSILYQWQPMNNTISTNTMQDIKKILKRHLNASNWSDFIVTNNRRNLISYDNLSEAEEDV